MAKTNEAAGASNSVSTPDQGVGIPKKGDVFRCSVCGMAISVTADCKCKDEGHVHFHCCGQELQKA